MVIIRLIAIYFARTRHEPKERKKKKTTTTNHDNCICVYVNLKTGSFKKKTELQPIMHAKKSKYHLHNRLECAQRRESTELYARWFISVVVLTS